MVDEVKEDLMEDIPKEFHEAVRKHGREKYVLLMCMGMGREASQRLGALVQKHQSQGGAHALEVLINSLNTMARAIVIDRGWTPAEIDACDKDLVAAAKRVVLPPASALILPTRH